MGIVVNLACGLANRMFQYSYYLYLGKMGYKVSVDYYTIKNLPHEKVGWNDIFPRSTFVEASKWSVFKLGGGQDLLSRVRRKYLYHTTHVQQMPSAFSVELPKGEDCYVMGVFQNAKMVEEVAQEVKSRFAFQPFGEGKNHSLEDEIRNSNSVAIHVRKGKDYQERIWYQNTCPVDYYSKAVAWMKENTDNPVFYVFTDNPDWVREHFKGFDYTLVDWNPGAGPGSHFDMQLMSLCHHNIISNSTYSWWGAFLNAAEDKVVILPEVWFNPGSCDDYTSEKLRCEGWIQL